MPTLTLTTHEARFLQDLLQKEQEINEELELTSRLPEDRKDARRDCEMCSAIKVKIVVAVLMEV